MWETLRFIYMTARLANLRKRQHRQVLALQQRRFRRILLHAFEHSPFYRRKFRGLDLRSCSSTELPTLTKTEMMEHFDELVTDSRVTRTGAEQFIANPANLGRFFLDRYVVCHTSGSQGQPAVIVQEPDDLMRTTAVQVARGHPLPKRWRTFLKRLGHRDRWVVVGLRPAFYPSGVAFAYMPRAARRFTNLLRLSLFDPLAENVARLNQFRPTFITSYASVLETLAREERDGRLQLRKTGSLRMITNISEPLTPAGREMVEKTFGVHVSDHYAMGECMTLSIGCPIASGAHVNADLAMLEVVDEKYRPVPNGTPGSKILITNFFNRVQPFIRYEIDDIVTMNPSRCPCGSNLPHIQAITGRTQDTLWVHVNGKYRKLASFSFVAALIHCFELAEYQILQTGINRFALRAVPLRGRTISLEQLRRLMDDALKQEGLLGAVELDIQLVDEIKREGSSAKMKRIKNLVGPPPETSS